MLDLVKITVIVVVIVIIIVHKIHNTRNNNRGMEWNEIYIRKINHACGLRQLAKSKISGATTSHEQSISRIRNNVFTVSLLDNYLRLDKAYV